MKGVTCAVERREGEIRPNRGEAARPTVDVEELTVPRAPSLARDGSGDQADDANHVVAGEKSMSVLEEEHVGDANSPRLIRVSPHRALVQRDLELQIHRDEVDELLRTPEGRDDSFEPRVPVRSEMYRLLPVRRAGRERMSPRALQDDEAESRTYPVSLMLVTTSLTACPLLPELSA